MKDFESSHSLEAVFHEPLESYLFLMEGEQGKACRRIYDDNRDRINNAPGSRGAHHAWAGGYREHVEQTMAYFTQLYLITPQTHLPSEERFTLSEGLVVLFLHDIEKPFMYEMDKHGHIFKNPAFSSKEDRGQFRQNVLKRYGLELTDNQENALLHVEGVRDEYYVPGQRIDSPLAALCHAADNVSARALYNFSKQA